MICKTLKLSFLTVGTVILIACGSNNNKSQTSNPSAQVENNGHRPPPPRGEDQRDPCEALKEGPEHSSEHGPMDNADLNRDGTVLREELETFMNQGEYRRVTLLRFFDTFDTDQDRKLSAAEFAKVNPPHSFNGTDANGDCIVTREEVIAYVNQEGRSYRKIGLGKFFDLLDTNKDNKVTPEEIEAAHQSGLLARF